MEKKVIITFDAEKGELTVEGEGYVDFCCAIDLDFFCSLLNLETKEVKNKPEFYRTQQKIQVRR